MRLEILVFLVRNVANKKVWRTFCGQRLKEEVENESESTISETKKLRWSGINEIMKGLKSAIRIEDWKVFSKSGWVFALRILEKKRFGKIAKKSILNLVTTTHDNI